MIKDEIPSKISHEALSSMIRFHRKASGLTQVELASMAGVGKTFIFDLEKGRKTVQLDMLIKVLSVLNIKVSFESPLMVEYIRSEV